MSDQRSTSLPGMSIKEAKQQVKNAMVAYFSKDAYGNYVIPVERQRPIFLLGAPGIGKTAIMSQIADELDVGLVSYSMTHHTRQSALGLPFIVKRSYGGREYDVSEYTMSEIIASVYECMEATGHKEGILFLDEINCVSETLTPAMLQFLQYKTFGRHAVPQGWIVVTAGNPPEFNRNVHEFDIVTWDRLKRIDVRPDYDAWKEYAVSQGVHPAVLSYLEVKTDDFYRIATTPEGRSFVTPRGWDDLSQMIWLYERNDICVDENLTGQYLQDKRVARDFAIYYELFDKYRSDYQVPQILEGTEDPAVRERAAAAPVDERLSLISLLINAMSDELRDAVVTEKAIAHLHADLTLLKEVAASGGGRLADEIDRLLSAHQRQLDQERTNGTLTADKQEVLSYATEFLKDAKLAVAKAGDVAESEAFASVAADFGTRVDALDQQVETGKQHLDNLFKFAEEVFDGERELLLLVTDLSVNRYSVAFIGEYGCERYFKHNQDLLFFERKRDIKDRLERGGFEL